MEKVFVNGVECNTVGDCPKVGEKAPDFKLTGKDLSEVKLEDYRGKKVVLNVFPSVDTPVCARSVRTFNKDASEMENTVVICISEDLPFAQARFCAAEGLDNVVMASAFRDPEFGVNYGLTLADGPLRGLLARCVFVIDESGRVAYRDLVKEITNDPNFEEALDAVRKLK